jgi:hypothetical protein
MNKPRTPRRASSLGNGNSEFESPLISDESSAIVNQAQIQLKSTVRRRIRDIVQLREHVRRTTAMDVTRASIAITSRLRGCGA